MSAEGPGSPILFTCSEDLLINEHQVTPKISASKEDLRASSLPPKDLNLMNQAGGAEGNWQQAYLWVAFPLPGRKERRVSATGRVPGTCPCLLCLKEKWHGSTVANLHRNLHIVLPCLGEDSLAILPTPHPKRPSIWVEIMECRKKNST